MKKPFRISEIKLDNILYSNPVIKDDKKNIFLKYNNSTKKQQFLIQTPELTCLSTPKLKNDIYEITVELNGNSSKKVSNLINFFDNLDDKINKLGNQNSKWFKNKKSLYKKIIRNEDSETRLLKLKVKKNNIPKYLKVTRNKQSDIALIEDIQKGNKIKLVLDIFGLWIREKNNVSYYGIYLKPVLIDFRSEIVEDISFIEDSDSENEVLDTEFEQQYDNTETSLMNVNNLDNTEGNNIEDSVCNTFNLTIEDVVPSQNNSENIDTNIKISNTSSESSIENSDNYNEDSDSDDNSNPINIITNYNNDNSDSSSLGNIENFNLTSEANFNE